IGLGPLHERILVLGADALPGSSVAAYLQIPPDILFTIEVTPNRGDVCSHWGIARELRALLRKPLQFPSIPSPQLLGASLPMEVCVEAGAGCPRYMGVVLADVQVAPSPLWLQNRLKSIGVSCINNVVDVTNFVLHELGQPLHAFDYDKIEGHALRVGKA